MGGVPHRVEPRGNREYNNPLAEPAGHIQEIRINRDPAFESMLIIWLGRSASLETLYKVLIVMCALFIIAGVYYLM